jgi:hypothetical protein
MQYSNAYGPCASIKVANDYLRYAGMHTNHTASPNGVNNSYRSIKSKLLLYESVQDSPALLELGILKSKITEQYGQSNTHLIT